MAAATGKAWKKITGLLSEKRLNDRQMAGKYNNVSTGTTLTIGAAAKKIDKEGYIYLFNIFIAGRPEDIQHYMLVDTDPNHINAINMALRNQEYYGSDTLLRPDIAARFQGEVIGAHTEKFTIDALAAEATRVLKRASRGVSSSRSTGSHAGGFSMRGGSGITKIITKVNEILSKIGDAGNFVIDVTNITPTGAKAHPHSALDIKPGWKKHVRLPIIYDPSKGETPALTLQVLSTGSEMPIMAGDFAVVGPVVPVVTSVMATSVPVATVFPAQTGTAAEVLSRPSGPVAGLITRSALPARKFTVTK